ncbi:MAG: class I SAM-dependent methyltransferase [Acidobacteria bacterium]|nr:class I SAM-dependent methyltransferase [Acidobacteriota bacterium]
MSTLMEPLEYQVLFQREEEHWWFVGMRRIFRVWVEDRLRGHPCRILDAGCGTGRMVQELASWDGARACGVELSDLAVGLARRRTAAPLARGDVLCLPFKPKSFDLVTSFDVLPNLQRPQHVAAVSESYRVLKPGGLFFVRCAAFPSLRGCHSMHAREVSRFRLGELRGLLQDAGFELIRASYANAFLFPLAWLKRRVLEPAGIARTHTDILPLPSWINGLFARLLGAEALWFRRPSRALPFGLSVICLAQKPA